MLKLSGAGSSKKLVDHSNTLSGPTSSAVNKSRININNLTLNYQKQDDNNISSLKSLSNTLTQSSPNLVNTIKMRRN